MVATNMARDLSLADIRRAAEEAGTVHTKAVGGEADTTALLSAFAESLPDTLDLDPDDPEHGLATLVLSLVELLRELLERQAIRRMEHGNLSEEDIDRLGDAFFRLKEKTDELKTVFGVSDDDLKLGFIEEHL